MTWWGAIDTESVSDSGSSITVLVVSLSLVALGVALLGVTIWFWRLTRPDPDALGPLVVMSSPDFFRRGPIDQRRSLDAARPGAVELEAPIELEPDQASTADGAVVPDRDDLDDDLDDELDEFFDLEIVEPFDVEADPQETQFSHADSDGDEGSRRTSIDPLL